MPWYSLVRLYGGSSINKSTQAAGKKGSSLKVSAIMVLFITDSYVSGCMAVSFVADFFTAVEPIVQLERFKHRLSHVLSGFVSKSIVLLRTDFVFGLRCHFKLTLLYEEYLSRRL